MSEQSTETQEGTQEGQEGTQDATDAQEGTQEPETFPRAYVENLRRENAEHRTRAQRADDLSERLMDATVASATAGILADPTDLDVSTNVDSLLDDDGMPDPELIAAAARDLVSRKPHFAARQRPTGDIGQGASAIADNVDLAGMLRSRAG